MGVSVYHEGEIMVQERMGVRAASESLGRRMLRDSMTEQHREFFSSLGVLFVATRDEQGRPWASLWTGEPGFVATPSPRQMVVSAVPLVHDPGRVQEGSQVGLLGLEFSNRRRNRMNGRVSARDSEGFTVAVEQAYGNCPAFIQTRDLLRPGLEQLVPKLEQGAELTEAARRIISGADTFFIASAHEGRGLDLSHRGGRPGFVRLLDDRRFVWPDFSGNNMFNTVGNITSQPLTGYLFVDFEKGTLLYLSGRTYVQWEGPEVEAFEGAQRLMNFEVDHMVLVCDSLPYRWRFREYSPSLQRTGQWSRSPERYEVVKKVRESAQISSFYLRPLSGRAIPFRPGQHLAIRLGEKGLMTRTYSLSGSPGEECLRISVKREPRGIGSRFLHDRVEVGHELVGYPPSGDFVLQESTRPVVFLSAGVGITPLLSMAHSLTDRKRAAWFIHGSRNRGSEPFGEEMRQLSEQGVRVHRVHSQPDPEEVVGVDYDSVGRIGSELLQQLLPLDDYDFYLCGPVGFLEDLHRQLGELGVPSNRVFYEAFGRTPKLEQEEPVEVHFQASEQRATWTGGTLLELAEESGLAPNFSCRSGSCGVCQIPLLRGKVAYRNRPTFEPTPGSALLCCARPAGGEESLVIEV